MGGAKACHLLGDAPAVKPPPPKKPNCGPSSSRPHLHVYGAAHNSGARGLSAPAVRTERLLSGLQMSPQPRRAICRFLQVGVRHGRAGRSQVFSARVGSRVWPVWETERGPPEYYLVSCQLPSVLLFTRTHLLKLW